MKLSYNQSLLKFYSILFARRVGVDDYGNTYFCKENNSPINNYRQRRWVIYQGAVEASKVPAEWNAWLHHVTQEIPKKTTRRPNWIKKHLPNQTGTVNAEKSKKMQINKKLEHIYSLWKPDD
tara:strand:- start:171 stop:536 length:366 start_codon:yes stop_codon:yes gene_type:complete